MLKCWKNIPWWGKAAGRGAGSCFSVSRSSPLWDAGSARSWLLSWRQLQRALACSSSAPRNMRGIAMAARTRSRRCGQDGPSFGSRPHVPGESFPGCQGVRGTGAHGHCAASLVTALGSSPAQRFCLKRNLVPESRRIKTGFKSYVVQLLGL